MENDEEKIPKDLLNNNLSTYNSNHLFEFFNKKDGDIQIIKNWAKHFPLNNANSYCEILSTIFQLAGKRIEITIEHLESDALSIVLEEFQEDIESQDENAPLLKFIKDKNSNVLKNFWDELTKSIISCNALYSEIFKWFREWIVNLCNTNAKILRISSLYCALSLFDNLAEALSRTSKDYSRCKQLENPSEIIEKQISVCLQEMKIYLSVANFIFNKVIINRISDNDENIRSMTIHCFTDGIIEYPSEFANFNKMKIFGKALNDTSSKIRRDTLRCIQRILSENMNSKVLEQIQLFSENYAPLIIDLCNDRDNLVVASSLECLLILTEKGLLKNDNDCLNLVELLSDDSQAIRASAAKFVAKQFFNNKESELSEFISFAQKFNDDDLPGIVASLYKNLKCIRKWEDICEMLKQEQNIVRSRVIAKVLLYSSERTLGHLLSTTPENSKKVRKLTLALVKNLPNLIKAYQTDDETVLPLIDASRLIDLDTVSESSYDHMYEKLLAEIRNLFLNSTNKQVFTTALSSIYDLSLGTHQLSQVAKKELDRLAVGCSSLENNESIAKFVAASRLVDVSGGGKIYDIIIDQIQNSNDIEKVSDCIECLQYIFKWDIKSIHSGKISKESYLPKFYSYIKLFSDKLFNNEIKNAEENENASNIIQEQAFKSLGAVIALSPFVKKNMDEIIIEEELIQNFYVEFHKLAKSDTFKAAYQPIMTHAVDISYSAHLLVYYPNEQFQVQVKSLWKELIPFKPIKSDKVMSAFEHVRLPDSQIKIAARFLFGKMKSYEFIYDFLNSNTKEAKLMYAIFPFFFGINQLEAKELLKIENSKFEEILRAIANGEKPTQKMLSKLIPSNKNQTNESNNED